MAGTAATPTSVNAEIVVAAPSECQQSDSRNTAKQRARRAASAMKAAEETEALAAELLLARLGARQGLWGNRRPT